MSSAESMDTVEIDGTSYSVPAAFICPITQELMAMPVMKRCGTSFERNAILSWLMKSRDIHGKGTCPLTRESLSPSQLVSNSQLQKQILLWRQQNGLPPNDYTSADQIDSEELINPFGDDITVEVPIGANEILAGHPFTDDNGYDENTAGRFDTNYCHEVLRLHQEQRIRIALATTAAAGQHHHSSSAAIDEQELDRRQSRKQRNRPSARVTRLFRPRQIQQQS